jgi:hypothetical protein
MKYKLLKDTPTINAETIGELDPETNLIGFRTNSDVAGRYWEFYSTEFLDSKPDWFEPVIERWRAGSNENYFHVGSRLSAEKDYEEGTDFDESRFINGNYFQTHDKATEAAKRIKQTLMDYHKELAK